MLGKSVINNCSLRHKLQLVAVKTSQLVICYRIVEAGAQQRLRESEKTFLGLKSSTGVIVCGTEIKEKKPL